MKYFLLTLLISALLFVVAPQAHAIDNTKEGLSYVCLNLDYCLDEGSNCSVDDVHRARLTSGDKRAVPNDKKAYVTECLDVDTDGNGVTETICTTGNPVLDTELLGEDNFTKLQNATHGADKKKVLYNLDGSMGEHVKTSKAPYGVYYQEGGELVKKDPTVTVQTDGRGNIIPSVMEWQSYSDVKLARRYLLYNIVTNPVPTDRGLGGQQLDDLGTAWIQSNCQGKAWDPYGRVFDAKTLEPIPGVDVTLKMYNPKANPPAYEEQYANTMNPNLGTDNPDVSDIYGGFEFIVQDGLYTLTPLVRDTALKTQYTHPKSDVLSTLSSNISSIYSNLYFSDSNPIKQQGVIQQRDIPLMPTNGVGYHYDFTVEPFQTVTQNGQQIFSGRVSIPYAILKVSICPNDSTASECGTPKVYTASEGGPGKDGKYRVILDQTKLVAGQKYTVSLSSNPNLATAKLTWTEQFQKVVASMMSHFVPSVQAQEKTKTVTFDVQPIPTYIEGYAYDEKGVLMPNAIVGVYVPFSAKPVYQTIANENGYFKITSEYLPENNYSIAYRSTDAATPQAQLTTSQFMAQNKEFIEAEKVNPYLYATQTTDPRRTVTPSFVPKKTTDIVPIVSETPVVPSVSPAPSTTQNPGTQNPLILIGAILLLLVATAGTLLAVYLYRKKMRDEPTDMNP